MKYKNLLFVLALGVACFAAGRALAPKQQFPARPLPVYLTLQQWNQRLYIWSLAAQVAGRGNAPAAAVDVVRDSLPVWNKQMTAILSAEVMQGLEKRDTTKSKSIPFYRIPAPPSNHSPDTTKKNKNG